jgi:hypothetical protein
MPYTDVHIWAAIDQTGTLQSLGPMEPDDVVTGVLPADQPRGYLFRIFVPTPIPWATPPTDSSMDVRLSEEALEDLDFQFRLGEYGSGYIAGTPDPTFMPPVGAPPTYCPPSQACP